MQPTSIEWQVFKNCGHPWDGRPGFDVLEVRACNQARMDQFLAAAALKHWHGWLIGFDAQGLPAGALYKPSGITVQWHDDPSNPHPGRIRAVALGA